MSHNENRSRQTQSTTNNVTNLNVQDTDGVTIAGSDNVTVTTTDHGALDAARDFANSALDVGVEALRMGQTNLDTAAGLAGRGLDTALDATRGALDFSDSVVRSNERVASDAISRIADFGGVAIGEVRGFGDSALGEVSGISREAINSVLDAGAGVLDFASGIFDRAIDAQANLAGQNLNGLTQLARQTSESADDRVSRTAMYAFVAIAAVFVLPALFGTSK